MRRRIFSNSLTSDLFRKNFTIYATIHIHTHTRKIYPGKEEREREKKGVIGAVLILVVERKQRR